MENDMDFFEFGKNSKFDDPPPSDLGKKLKLGKFWIWETPLGKKYKIKKPIIV